MECTAGESPVAGGFHVTAGKGNLCAKRLEPLQVQIDRARAPGASAGERDAAAAEAGNERAEHVKACTHGLHEFVGRFQVVGTAGVNL